VIVSIPKGNRSHGPAPCHEDMCRGHCVQAESGRRRRQSLRPRCPSSPAREGGRAFPRAGRKDIHAHFRTPQVERRTVDEIADRCLTRDYGRTGSPIAAITGRFRLGCTRLWIRFVHTAHSPHGCLPASVKTVVRRVSTATGIRRPAASQIPAHYGRLSAISRAACSAISSVSVRRSFEAGSARG
jgi:hypothetical protein